MAKKMIGKYPVAVVHWEDSIGGSGWHGVRSHKRMKPCLCESAGYLIKATKRHWTLALSVDSGLRAGAGNKEEEVSGFIIIPRAAIKEAWFMNRQHDLPRVEKGEDA